MLKEELLAMQKEDSTVRERLAADGSLYRHGYHPEMEAVHKRNAERLQQIIQTHGWPGRSMVGEEGVHAAWMIVQHAISLPAFQRASLRLLRTAVAANEAPAWQMAMLEDRIRFLEGKPQIYGTQLDWDENGELSPYPEIEDRQHVDERRAAVGLGPLEQTIANKREEALASGETPPQDLTERRKQMQEWAESVGWRV